MPVKGCLQALWNMEYPMQHKLKWRDEDEENGCCNSDVVV